METVDEEFLAAAKDFIDRQHKADKPFFVWFNSTRMHVFTHLKPESLGKTGKGIHADGMVEHDGMVGELLEAARRPRHRRQHDRALHHRQRRRDSRCGRTARMTPFHGEKGTTWEGGFRIPMMVRWPGVIKPGTVYNDIISLIDWFPTLLRGGRRARTSRRRWRRASRPARKTFKVHLDGYNFLPYFKGEAKKAGPRDAIYYFDQGGNLNAVRWNDWKLSFAVDRKATSRPATREVPVLGADHEPAHGPL